MVAAAFFVRNSSFTATGAGLHNRWLVWLQGQSGQPVHNLWWLHSSERLLQWAGTAQDSNVWQYSTVQYITVQYSIVQYSTVQYSTVQYSTVQYSTVQYSTVQYSTVQYSTVQYSSAPRTCPHWFVKLGRVQYSTTGYKTGFLPSKIVTI